MLRTIEQFEVLSFSKTQSLNSSIKENVGLCSLYTLPAKALYCPVRKVKPIIASPGICDVVSSTSCPAMLSQCKQFIGQRPFVYTVPIQLKPSRQFNRSIVFGQIVVEPFQANNQNSGGIFQIKFSPCLLSSATLASKIILFTQTLWREETIQKCLTRFFRRILQSFSLDLILRDFSLWQSNMLSWRFRQLDRQFQAKVKAPTHFLTSKALQPSSQEKSKQLLSGTHQLSILRFDLKTESFSIDQSIQKNGEQLLGILLVHVFVLRFHFACPAEYTFRRKMLLYVTQIFIPKQIDFAYLSKLSITVKLQVGVLVMQLLAGVETLQSRVEEASISQILQSKNLQLNIVEMLGLKLFVLLYLCLVSLFSIINFLLLFRIAFLLAIFNFLLSFDYLDFCFISQFLCLLNNPLVYFADFLFFIALSILLEHGGNVLFTSKAIYTFLTHLQHNRVFGAIEVLERTLVNFIITTDYSTIKTEAQRRSLMFFIPRTVVACFNNKVGNFFDFETKQMFAQ